MYPELIHQMVLERTARFQRDAARYRLAREAHIRPPQPVRTAIELGAERLREELGRFARCRAAAGRSAE